jgi:two-component system, OmpR family, phosphate regulon sensor histidine kinase PhoR
LIWLSILCVALAIACVWFAVTARRDRRDRRSALALLHAPDQPIAVAVQRELRNRVPRDDLSAMLFSREAVLDATPEPVIVFDAHGQVVRVNAAARQALPAAEPGAAAAAISPDLAAALDAVLSGPPALDCEIATGDPTRRTYEARLRSHPDGDGRAAVAVLSDVTAAVDFRESRRLFSAAVSHELRTPLARILGLVETLALPQSQAEREALVAQTEIEVDNMRRLIDEMLLLAALDRGEVVPSNETADPGAIADAVIADARARRTGRGRRLEADVVPGLRVAIAGRLLQVVIGNLVDNALRHGGPDATVTVVVRALAGEVEIDVTDTGLGIAPEHLPHVFERFYRGDAARAGAGTGLGLAVVKHIIEAHEGRVAAESVPGEGTTVRIVLPEPDEPPA